MDTENDDNQNSSSKSDNVQNLYMSFDAGMVTQQTDISGVTFDFNYGARVQVPEGNYSVKLIDLDACLTIYSAVASNVMVTSNKKYFIEFRIEVYKDDKLIFAHNMDLKDKKVLIEFPTGILGDVIAWFPYAEVFRRKHQCDLYCAIGEDMSEILRAGYPDINFIGPSERPDNIYASYYMGIFFPCDDRVHQPVDFRVVGLHKHAAYILGLEVTEERPRLLPKNRTRQIKEPYVCIAAQSSSQAKYWNNGMGWIEVVKHLKFKGYRVLCIDREPVHGMGSRFNIIPYGAEDFTGNIALQERIDLLYHADFFVGLSSGLSWVAWGTGKPIVLISGFTLPINEFETKYRVSNCHVCNGCWNDTRIAFDHKDFEWCPRLKGTQQQFECSRYITADAVKKKIDQLMLDYNLQP